MNAFNKKASYKENPLLTLVTAQEEPHLSILLADPIYAEWTALDSHCFKEPYIFSMKNPGCVIKRPSSGTCLVENNEVRKCDVWVLTEKEKENTY